MSNFQAVAKRPSRVIEGWTVLDCDVVDPALTISPAEYGAAEGKPELGTAPSGRGEDMVFDAVLKMKNEPLVLTDAQVEAYADLKRRRARRMAKPLPLE